MKLGDSTSARIAELTDIVTELVLPLHDREIDAERLRPVSAETLSNEPEDRPVP